MELQPKAVVGLLRGGHQGDLQEDAHDSDDRDSRQPFVSASDLL